MRKIIFVVVGILMIGCGVTVDSIVDNSLFNAPFKRPLIIIPQSDITYNFTIRLKERLSAKLEMEKIMGKFLLFENDESKLSLNNNSQINLKIDSLILNERIDLLIAFHPKKFESYNGGLQVAIYEVVATNVATKKEVWKANFKTESSLGPALFAKKSAEEIVNKLKTDKLL